MIGALAVLGVIIAIIVAVCKRKPGGRLVKVADRPHECSVPQLLAHCAYRISFTTATQMTLRAQLLAASLELLPSLDSSLL